MVEEIRENLIETFVQSTWLHENTRMRAIRKAELMKKVIGYPPEFEVPGALDNFFESRCGSHSSMIRISTYPIYAKIASIGEVIGHEMGHGFDTEGRRLDENGGKHDWWTSEDSAEYDRKAQCLIDQYNNYDDPDFGRNVRFRHNNQISSSALYAALLIVKNHEKPQTPSTPSRPVLEPVKHKGVCKSPECITLAHQLHNWRDVSVDPCQNFFKAVCGKYNEHSLYKNANLLRNTEIVANLIKEYLHKDLSSSSKSENAMKFFFDRCETTKRMNLTLVTLNEKREILKLIKQVGSWPMLNKSWNESEFDLNDMMSNMAKLGASKFGFFEVVHQVVDPYFDVDSANMTAGQLEKDIFEFLELNNVLFDIESARNDVRNIAKLIHDMAELLSAKAQENMREQGTDKMQENVPSIDFERITKNLFNPKRQDVVWEKLKTKFYSFPGHPYFSNKTRNHVMNIFPLAALRVYVRNHYDKENLELASEMVEEIRKTLIETFMKSTWLHENTRMRAIRKAELMKKVIGYPPEFEVPGALDNFFESVTFTDTDSYFTTFNKALKLQKEQYFDHHSGFLSIAPDIRYLTSALRIPFIDDPYFDSTYPKYARIASIGEAIGHEMGHGFDTTGRKLDENGQEYDWWASGDSDEYDRKAQCLIDQYNNYDDPDFGINLNGSTTIKEMAADIIGISVSLKTYNKVDFFKEPSIFGFEDEKPDKLFFHITALNWCRARDTTPLATQLTAVHPTANFRVNGVFANMKSFAEAFNCPVGSPMNPKKKCELF
ncbi:hypothetical protein B9Z55_020983 [Caenorhabditis nigoni]|uniref:Peptidase M13 C-terminal domain-containing protein n=1 Tax=Caenorhabditis nigoni TaxID=1611254 RepID=A0A2G5TQW7_9PELO|nr:hypothetical protein B9Z55_020983 [Caenorhabditis nigoni]